MLCERWNFRPVLLLAAELRFSVFEKDRHLSLKDRAQQGEWLGTAASGTWSAQCSWTVGLRTLEGPSRQRGQASEPRTILPKDAPDSHPARSTCTHTHTHMTHHTIHTCTAQTHDVHTHIHPIHPQHTYTHNLHMHPTHTHLTHPHTT